MLGDSLKVAVNAPPEKGKANEAVVELLAQFFGVAVSSVTIQSGHTQPRKTVVIEGLSPAEVACRLGSK
jgi:hypothetical protein